MQAQENVELKPGPEIHLGNESLSSIFESGASKYFFLKINNKGYLDFRDDHHPGIITFGKNLSREETIDLKPHNHYNLRRLIPQNMYQTSSGFIFLCRNYSRMDETLRAYLFRTDMQGNVSGPVLVPGEIGGMLPSQEDFHYFQLNEFIDGNEKRYIFSLTTPPELDIPERVNLVVFDENLEKVSEHLFSFPDDFIDYYFSKQIVSPEGQIFFRLEIFNPVFPDEIIHQLIIYDLIKDRQRTYEFKLEEGFVGSLKFQSMQNNRVGLFGFFTLENDSESPDGILYYIFNGEDGSLISQNIRRLDEEIIEIFDPGSLKSSSGYQHLQPGAIHLNEQGHVLLLFEYNWRSILMVRDQRQQIYPTPMYNANEVMILNFNPSGELLNCGIIQKQQSQGIAPEVSGFFSYCKNNRLYLFYNDHPKNTDRYASREIKIMKNRYEPVLAIYDPNEATYTKHRFQGRVAFNPDDLFTTGENSLLILNFDEAYWLSEICFTE